MGYEISTRQWRWRWSRLAVMVAALAQQALVLEVEAGQGQWRVVTTNAGVSAMHAGVTPVVGSVVLLHHSNTGPSNITFPDGRCRLNTKDKILPRADCFAHSVILDPNSGVVRPLMLRTDTQCSSGQFLADGTLGQTGGDREGRQKTRTLSPSCYIVEPTNKICDWVESTTDLKVERWYSTNTLLPDGRQIVVGGRNTFTMEFAPPSTKIGAVYMDFLNKTATKKNVNNLYPFVHLLPSGHVYIFANRDSIVYDYKKNVVIRTFEQIPGNPRNYPSGGSSVMLPLTYQSNFQTVEVLVCGGAWSTRNKETTCSVTCGRIEVTKADSTWAMEDMPNPRCMGDMVLLPDTNVLIVNGAQKGFQSWRSASVAALNPLLYEPSKTSGQRFSVMDGTLTPRVYHSTANLLTDGSVMVAGSNTHEFYSFKNFGDISAQLYFPTELSVEAFTPPYAQNVAGGRPAILSPANGTVVRYRQVLEVVFWDYPSTPTPPPAESPPAETPPAETPPAGTPPAETPPAGTPPAETPPAGTPPAGTPPAETPPAGTPPAETPPAETPPAGTPPAETPPALAEVPAPPPKPDTFLFTLMSSPWSTHSYSHGQRLVTLKAMGEITTVLGGRIENGVSVNLRTANLQIPKYSTVLPPAYYMLWVVKNGNPSQSCIWVRIKP